MPNLRVSGPQVAGDAYEAGYMVRMHGDVNVGVQRRRSRSGARFCLPPNIRGLNISVYIYHAGSSGSSHRPVTYLAPYLPGPSILVLRGPSRRLGRTHTPPSTPPIYQGYPSMYPTSPGRFYSSIAAAILRSWYTCPTSPSLCICCRGERQMYMLFKYMFAFCISMYLCVLYWGKKICIRASVFTRSWCIWKGGCCIPFCYL